MLQRSMFLFAIALFVLLQSVHRASAAVRFGQALYQASIDEELPVGSSIQQLVAVDSGTGIPYSPGAAAFAVSGGTDATYFQVGHEQQW